MTGSLNGIPRVDLPARPLWKRELSWLIGGKLFTTDLLAHPDCELHIGPNGGRFVAHEVTGPDRGRLYALAADRLNKGWNTYAQRTDGIRTIPVLRLSADGRT
ncbi:nitroreductase/quinone reductase family protein [Mycolicibacterium porcinum]|uniref:nitroreductase/quinone reductase family protein n=1 Tax=Mycolicibacterium porcinum TaxID=39693 RepID=UPI000848E60C|nr:nitroreductase/quinone reductase family protein [Mycolicibacterium porcinum]ODR26737.1 hypothetical protein BHQ19_05110 [Mycolicibacterium porcinum]